MKVREGYVLGVLCPWSVLAGAEREAIASWEVHYLFFLCKTPHLAYHYNVIFLEF